MTCAFVLTPAAEDDLVDIYRYVAVKDSVARADQLLDRLQDLWRTLAHFPLRGRRPAESATMQALPAILA